MDLSAESVVGQETPAKKQPRFSWHLLYYLLVVFNVLAVSTGLYITHRIMAIHTNSMAVNQEWSDRRANYSELGQVAATVNAPGNDVFESHDVQRESNRTSAALRSFNERLHVLREDLQVERSQPQLAPINQDIDTSLRDMDEIQSAMANAAVESEKVFYYFKQNQLEMAGKQMAAMNRAYAQVATKLVGLRSDMTAIQKKLFDAQTVSAASLQKAEYVLGGLILLMVCGAIIFGYKIKHRMDVGERESEQYVHNMQKARAALHKTHDELELRVEARTVELAKANEGLLAEISERKHTEEALRASETKFRSLTNSAADAILSANSRGEIISWNTGAQAIFGYTEEEALGKPLKILMPERYREAHQHGMERYTATGEAHVIGKTVELQGLKKDGSEFPIDLSLSVWKSGEETFYSGIIRDITTRKRADEELRKSEERFQLATRATNDAVWDWDLVTNELWWNEGFQTMFGYRADEIEPGIESRTSRLHPDDLKDIEHSVHEVIDNGGQSWTGEYRFRRADGSYALVADRGYVVHDAEGKPVRMLGSMMDITERKRVEAELFKLASIVEYTDDAIIGKALDGTIHSWNTGAEKLFGYSAEEVVGKHLPALFPPDRLDEEPQIIERIMRGESIDHYETVRISKEGAHIPISLVVSPIKDADGAIVGISKIARDITERKQIEEELRQARDSALESARLKSEFLANMSHEIRTPMNGVIGMTGLLLDSELNAEQRDFTETIRTSADSLLTIINDILDFSKIEAGKLHFEMLDFDMRTIVESTVELLAERAQAKGIELASLVDSNVPTQLRGDAGRLRQVLVNLVSNAVKFTETGEVTVRATKESETDTHVMIRYAVNDTGIGISPEAARRLFQAFIQADGSTTRKYGGTGLGLAISRQIVELMGGKIGVESEPGKGSTFWFTVRLEKQPDDVETMEFLQRADLHNLRVLVVDDNATNRRILMHQTLSWGMVPSEAESGMIALELLRAAKESAEPYDVALLDFNMPEMDGFELAREIKADAQLAATRLVLMPSFGLRGDAQKAREVGIAAYLMKPVRQSQLFDCLATVMTETKASAPSASRASKLVTRHTLEEFRLASRTRILIAEDNSVNQKVAALQIEKLGCRADLAANGQEAVEALARTPYDIVLMDCQMPLMDGYEATAKIREREGSDKHTIIIAMTAHALDGDKEKCLAAGMDDYLSKPVNAEELRDMLARWQPNSALSIELSDNSLTKQESVLELAPVDMERLLDAAGGDDEPLQDLIEIYLRQTSEDIEKLNAAIAAGDAGAVNRLAHSCAGASSTCGMTAVVAPLQELERMAEDGILENGAARLVLEAEKEFERIKLFLQEPLKLEIEA